MEIEEVVDRYVMAVKGELDALGFSRQSEQIDGGARDFIREFGVV